MSAATDYLEEALIRHIFRTGVFDKPTALWVALFTEMPSDSDTGTEVSGNGYARVQHGPADDKWTAPTGGSGETSNIGVITFPAPIGNWGQVIGGGVFDAPVGGNLLLRGVLPVPRTVEGGAPAPVFAQGDMIWRVA